MSFCSINFSYLLGSFTIPNSAQIFVSQRPLDHFINLEVPPTLGITAVKLTNIYYLWLFFTKIDRFTAVKQIILGGNPIYSRFSC